MGNKVKGQYMFASVNYLTLPCCDQLDQSTSVKHLMQLIGKLVKTLAEQHKLGIYIQLVSSS